MASPAAAHTLGLLQALGRRSSPQPASALARDLGLPRSTTYRILTVMKDAGFVTHDEDTRRWGLGIAAYELGSAYRRQQPLQRIAQATLTDLAERTGQCAHLAILHGTDVLYLIEERPLGVPPLVTDVGVRLPAHLTASGLAILAGLRAAQVRALFPDTSELVQRRTATSGPTSRTQLLAELAQVRQRGYAYENGTVTEGFASVACAAFDHNALPAASVAITWRAASDDAARASDGLTDLFAHECARAASALQVRLGGHAAE